ncbi:MAG: GAF domain-containing protein [Thermodesulfobacteriota bacterium]
MPKESPQGVLENQHNDACPDSRQMELASQESEKRLNQIVQGLTIAAFVIDQNHVITHCNRALESLTGISAKELVGTTDQWKTFYSQKRPTLADLIVDRVPEHVIAGYYPGKYRRSALVENAYEVEDFFPLAGGNGKWLFFTAAPLLDEDSGRIIGAIETLQDITDRKSAEQELRQTERRLRALLDFAPYPIVVFTLEGRVSYLNPAFSETFGWTLPELEGKRIPYIPPELVGSTREDIKRLLRERILTGYKSQRLTKDGRLLDVVIRTATFSEAENETAGIIVILRDVTQENRMTRNNEAMLSISMALPEYPDLQDLIYYVNSEVKRLLYTEGAIVVLYDEIKGDLFMLGAAYDDMATEKRVQEVRFPIDKLVSGQVIQSGEPVIINDTSLNRQLYEERDKKFGYQTRNLVVVPLKSSERTIGTLCAINKKEGVFDQSDMELLSLIAGTVALSIENARFSEDIKKALRFTEALLRISVALPMHPELDDRLNYVNSEIKRLLDSEGAMVILLDEEKQELFAIGAAFDATDTEERVEKYRFGIEELEAGKVIRTGEPVIINDTTVNRHLHEERDKKFGYKTRNLVLVPLRGRGRIVGVLCAINKKSGDFGHSDVELLSSISGTVALSIKNARVTEELKQAYTEVTGLNRAKDKVINHLSHELKTPVAIITSSLGLLVKKISAVPSPVWKPTIDRIKRNLNRILDIQYELNDIMQGKETKAYGLLMLLLDQCTDELESLIAENAGEQDLIDRLRKRIDELFGPAVAVSRNIDLGETLRKRLHALKSRFSERRLDIIRRIEPVPPILLPPEVVQKVVDGLIRNAIENTPDEGRIEVGVYKRGEGAVLQVHDYGVGITEEAQKRIFEGFFTSRDISSYSTRKPFEFNAGGKGADLLRMKIFSERYHFQIEMHSIRCRFIPKETDLCPGRISSCRFCTRPEDCHRSGETTFSVYFPAATGQESA